MKKIIVLFTLALAACGPSWTPCLNPGERGKIIGIQEFDDGTPNDVQVRLTTDNETIRICNGRSVDVTLLQQGDVIVGFDGDDEAYLYAKWSRVR